MARYVVSSPAARIELILIFLARSDCLAAPYSVTEDMNGAKEPVETCYKCKAPGHVRPSHYVPLGLLVYLLYVLFLDR
jgi:hypothetical protein